MKKLILRKVVYTHYYYISKVINKTIKNLYKIYFFDDTFMIYIRRNLCFVIKILPKKGKNDRKSLGASELIYKQLIKLLFIIKTTILPSLMISNKETIFLIMCNC